MPSRASIRAAAVALALAVASVAAAGEAAPAAGIPEGFVYLRALDPELPQDMRYAGRHNFTGRPLPGYVAGECVLLRPVAEALVRVQKELRANNLSLKVHDCYRPVRAVKAFGVWAGQPVAGPEEKAWFPRLEKTELYGKGWIAKKSGHSTGYVVDLTLIDWPAGAEPKPPAGPVSCAADAAARGVPEKTDLGTAFDCFDAKSNTASPEIPAAAKSRRAILIGAMAREGFKNYHKEWWHFSHTSQPKDAPAFDFEIAPYPGPVAAPALPALEPAPAPAPSPAPAGPAPKPSP